MEKGHKIEKILPGSIAEELELEKGDIILAVNDQSIEDVFDYQFLLNDSYIELTVLKSNNEEWILEIEKDEDEDLGIIFENGLMDDYLCNFMIKCVTLRNRFTHDYYKRDIAEDDIIKFCHSKIIYLDIFLESSSEVVRLNYKINS